MKVYSLFDDHIGKWKTSKCKDSVARLWKFIVYVIILLVNEQLESVRTQYQNHEFIVYCCERKTWKCKDSVAKPWTFIVYFMIILVNDKLESVWIQ